MTVLAGASTADITPGAGVPMVGYGLRVGVAEGRNDPLLVRTLAMTDEAGTTLAIAVCDLVGVPYGLVRQARDLIATELEIPPDNVLVAATHTHSGPMAVYDSSAYVETTARAIAGSVRVAMRERAPVVLKVGSVEITTVSQNRRDPDGPIERVARVLLAERLDDQGGPAVATLVNYACHSTVFEHDNLHWSADWPGAMARSIERAVGGTAIYLQGAAGNINPVWMRHDPNEVERVGGIVGTAAARVVHELRPLDAGQWCINLNWSEDVPAPPAAHGSLLENVRFRAARTTLEMPARVRRPVDELHDELADLVARIAAEPDVGARRAHIARRNALTYELQLIAATRGRSVERLELQAFRLADGAAVSSLPGEFFVEIGDELRARGGLAHHFIAGYANGAVGYVPTAEAFAHHGYEVGMARFAPETAATVVDASLSLLLCVGAEA